MFISGGTMFFFSRTLRAAFTIIEFLIVVAIIIFLAKVIVPRYAHYYAKARQAEVAVNLTALYTAQQSYYIEHGRYTSNFKELGWQPKGYTSDPQTTQNYYTYGSSSGQEGVHYFTGAANTSAHLLGDTIARGNKMLFKAVVQNGAIIETWQIDETGTLQKHINPV